MSRPDMPDEILETLRAILEELRNLNAHLLEMRN